MSDETEKVCHMLEEVINIWNYYWLSTPLRKVRKVAELSSYSKYIYIDFKVTYLKNGMYTRLFI